MHPLNIIIIVLIFTTTIFPQQSLIKNYTAVDGLPVSTIYDCVQASNGNMWFASENGLIEYDGQTWVLHEMMDGILANIPFRFLKKDNNGNLWAIPLKNNNMIFFQKNGLWRSFNQFSNDTNENTVAAEIFITNQDTIIAIANKLSEIFIYQNGKQNIIAHHENKAFRVYDIDYWENNLIICTDKGVLSFDITEESLQRFKSTAKFNNQTFLSCDISLDRRNNSKFNFLLTNSILRFSQDNLFRFETGVEIQLTESSLNFPFIKVIEDDKILLGSKYSGYYFNPISDRPIELTQRNGFVTTGATSAFVDFEKNIWITSFRGLSKLRFSPFYNFTSKEGLLENEVTSIEKFSDGKLILGHNFGFSVIDNERVYQTPLLPTNNSSAYSRILNMGYDKTKDLVLFNSQTRGIGTISKNLDIDWRYKVSGQQETLVLSLFVESSDQYYFATYSGLYQSLNDSIITLLDESLLNIRNIKKYNQNKLILASRLGVCLLDIESKEFALYKASENTKNDIVALYKFDTNNWLIGSYGGLLVFDGKELKEFPDLKISDPIFFIEKENDYIWFGLMGGALRWNPKTGEYRRFTTKDGFAGVETNRDAFLFDDNKVYIGTENGLSIFIPESYHAEYYEIKPKINFIGISDLDGNINNITEEIEFPHTNNDLIIMYNSPSFIDETAMTYSVLLENIDDGTTEIYNTNETSFYLRNLSPGEYKVGVSSINPNGVSSDTVYSNTIFIGSPFYIQSWFLALLVLLSVAVSYSIYNYIVRSRYSNLLEEKVKIRTSQLQESERNIRILTQRIFTAQEEQSEKIARDLHDHIAQDMAVLKLEVDKLIESNKSEHENYSWISDKISELTIYLRDLAYFLHANSIKQTGFVNSIHALCNDFNNHMKIDVEFFTNLEESFKISEESGNNIYRFIQEALWNVRKHSDANSALVILVTQDDSLIIRIEDDGKGFEVEDILHSSNSRRMGLKSMEERILFLQGKFSIKSMIKDGTKIKAVIPLSVINQSASEANVDQASTL